MYRKYFKRPMDIILSLCALIVLSPLMLIVAILVRVKLGSPVIFTQERPGKDEKIFKMYKFRSMSDEVDESGKLLPDSVRLKKFGKALRSSSLDELPELLNIIKGDMSVVGPRPQLIRDIVFMDDVQRRRQSITQGLTGWAQVNGRNNILWEDKINLDLEYIDKITFLKDMKIILFTVLKVFKSVDVEAQGMDTAEDFGDYLLRSNKITSEEYEHKMQNTRKLLINDKSKRRNRYE